MAIGVLGFLLGIRHATDPDHVIAISTIVTRNRSVTGAAAIGALWGVGHTLTVLVFGVVIIGFGWVIPERFGLSMELGVGLMLIWLGVITLRRVWQRRRFGSPSRLPPGTVRTHTHAHGDYVHTHVQGADPNEHPHREDQTPIGWLDRHLGTRALYHGIRPLLIGVVHGLAGSAAVVLLVLPAIGDPGWSAAYLLIFGIGTIVGMLLLTALIATPMAYSGRHAARVQGVV